MIFELQHRYFNHVKQTFDENTAPDWLTSVNTIKGSTMDDRWFWNDHILTLHIGGQIETDFNTITRIA